MWNLHLFIVVSLLSAWLYIVYALFLSFSGIWVSSSPSTFPQTEALIPSLATGVVKKTTGIIQTVKYLVWIIHTVKYLVGD